MAISLARIIKDYKSEVAADIVEIMCPTPPTITHGQPHYTRLKVGTQANYSCDQGYTVSEGDGRVTCAEDGTWYSIPICSRE